MRYLVDTNVLLWLRLESRRIGQSTGQLLKDPKNDVYVSIATAWELAIKIGLGKLNLPSPIHQWFELAVAESKFAFMAVELRHVYAVAAFTHHHRDPFDRLLLAQAQTDGLTFVTGDRSLAVYGIPILHAGV